MIWRIFKAVLFRCDAENVHHRTVHLIRRVGASRWGRSTLRWASETPLKSFGAAIQPKKVWGLEFRSRVGLAAGFDKDALLLPFLPDLGFGFAEIGTVTPKPQLGNPKPRLFREPRTRAIFNRMGFNNDGAEKISERVRIARADLPSSFRIGVNIGKNKETSFQETPRDYRAAIRPFREVVDYVVINVSSPNTPGLRDLQKWVGLAPILDAVGDEIQKWSTSPPVLLKLAPEVRGQDLKEIVENAEKAGLKGWVLTNTWAGTRKVGSEEVSGGWSGEPLQEAASKALVTVRSVSRLPVIAVGGIMSEGDALKRIRSGADLIQVYSGWIYGGPTLPMRITRALQSSL